MRYDTPVSLTGQQKQMSADQDMEPGVGVEPTAYALQVRCSTTELTRRGL